MNATLEIVSSASAVAVVATGGAIRDNAMIVLAACLGALLVRYIATDLRTRRPGEGTRQ